MPEIHWTRLDLPGEDAADLSAVGTGYRLDGHARFQDPTGMVDLRYEVALAAGWITSHATVFGTVAGRVFDLSIERAADGRWLVNRQRAPSVSGCLDLDLNFTPATNLISLRRLDLPSGSAGEVTAAWLVFPDMVLKPLRQNYRRLDEERYDYDCPEIPFSAILRVRQDGFVREYPPLWTER